MSLSLRWQQVPTLVFTVLVVMASTVHSQCSENSDSLLLARPLQTQVGSRGNPSSWCIKAPKNGKVSLDFSWTVDNSNDGSPCNAGTLKITEVINTTETDHPIACVDGDNKLTLKSTSSLIFVQFVRNSTLTNGNEVNITMKYKRIEDSLGEACDLPQDATEPTKVLTATDTEQNVSSPNFNNKFAGGAQCYWRISPTDTNKVLLLKLTSFDMNLTMSDEDLAIYDGPSTQIFSNRARPEARIFETRTSSVIVYFRSDRTDMGNGFQLTYEQVEPEPDNETLTATAQVQTLKFPLRADVYNSENTKEWTINTNASNHLKIMFEYVDIECYPSSFRDVLKIYDGPDAKSESLVGEICGTRNTAFLPIYSSSNTIFLRFTSSATVEWKGFRLTYQRVDTVPQPDPACGGEVLQLNATDEKQTLSSPGYPINYPTNLKCEWKINTENKKDSVVLEIEYFKINDLKLQGVRDQLITFTGPPSASGLTSKCSVIPSTSGQNCTSWHSGMKVTFESNELVREADVKFGFTAQYWREKDTDGGGHASSVHSLDILWIVLPSMIFLWEKIFLLGL